MNTDERLRSIELRLAVIEQQLGLKTKAPSDEKHPPLPLEELKKKSAPILPIDSTKLEKPSSLDATAILGWGGVAALVLAVTYLIRLAVDAGWLTPVRQMTIAALFGATLIVGGFIIKNQSRRYASLLPAAGIVVLFLADYGAHLYHGLIGSFPATVGVIGICILTLVLGKIFESEWYALFAVIGSYTGPILLENLRSTPSDLSIYFAGWGILYAWYAIVTKQRTIYLLAGYLSLTIFDAVWRMGGPFDWIVALGFQFVQFVLFAGQPSRSRSKTKTPSMSRSLSDTCRFYFFFISSSTPF